MPWSGSGSAGGTSLPICSSADLRRYIWELWDLAGEGHAFQASDDFGHGVELGALAHEVDLALVGGSAHHLAHELAVVVQLADQIVRVALEQLVEERPQRDETDEPGPHAAAPRLQYPGLHRARVGAVGHRDDVGVVEPQRLVAREVGTAQSALVHEAIRLSPLGVQLL